jgi:hypothetical protein
MSFHNAGTHPTYRNRGHRISKDPSLKKYFLQSEAIWKMLPKKKLRITANIKNYAMDRRKMKNKKETEILHIK